MSSPSLDGRRILITGANTGIGRATAVALAGRGAKLFLAGRSEARYAEVLSELSATGANASYLPLDLGDFQSVRACAARFLALGEPLHVLLNNAGLAGSRGTTADGFERTFGVNHLGSFLLTELLLERLKESAPSRIVNVASKAHYNATGIDWAALRQPTVTRTGMQEYNVSKLCNVLYAKELSRRLAGARVTTYSLHPGVIASDVWRNVPWGIRHLMLLFMQSNTEGAATSIHCASSEAAARESGLYYDACKPIPPSPLAEDVALADLLVHTSRGWVGL
jgi:NAD(P)-dependent dehydrogenase (short-subunit alcohol dehydrogenase family)